MDVLVGAPEIDGKIKIIRRELLRDIRQRPALYVGKIQIDLVHAYISGFEYLADELTGRADQVEPREPTYLEYLWWRNVGQEGLVTHLFIKHNQDHKGAINEYCDWRIDFERFREGYSYTHYFKPIMKWSNFIEQVKEFMSTHPDITREHLELEYVLAEVGTESPPTYKGRVRSRPLDTANEWEASLCRGTKQILEAPYP